MDIIVKKFDPHYNRALGQQINTQREYNDAMKKGGFVPYEQAKEQAKHNREEQGKMGYDRMSSKAQDLTREAFNLAKHGRGEQKPSDRMIDAWKEIQKKEKRRG